MKEYRAQLDADRAAKLSKGTNHADLRGALDDAKGKVGDTRSCRPVPCCSCQRPALRLHIWPVGTGPGCFGVSTGVMHCKRVAC